LKATVTVKWVKSRLGSRKIVLLDARSRRAYRLSHIPGARHADMFHYFVPGTDAEGLGLFHRDLARILGNLGISRTETVVVYESGFGMRAARVAWMLEYSGARRVFMLEGGFRAWKRLHYPVDNRIVKSLPMTFDVAPNPSLLATVDQILDLPKTALVLDVRTRGEYDGTEKRECCERAGRIPNATWHEWTEFLGPNGRFLKKREFEKAFPDLQGKRTCPIVTYCHRGARAASTFYALRSLGYSNVRNYVGSWHEWSSRSNLPLEPGSEAKS